MSVGAVMAANPKKFGCESEWPKVRLGEVVAIKHGWPFKSELFSQEQTGRPIVVSVGNFRYTGGFRFSETAVKEYQGDYPKEYELSAGDILLVMTCQTAGGEILGIPAKVPNDRRVYLHNQRLGKVEILDNSRIDRDFLYWLFLSPDFNRELVISASGTKILHTAPSRIEAFSFGIPSLPEQRAIAHILGTLDDKIELNRQRNQTLEGMARALFQDWFVDFGPVRAKMEGHEPYLPADLWSLFPDRLDDEGKPEGWASVPANELIEFNPTEPLRKGELAPYLDMASLPTSGSWPEPPVMRPYGSGMRFRNGDTLLARITPCLENGKTAFIQCLPEDTVGWGSTEYIVMRSKGPVPAEYAYLLARDPSFREHAIRSMTGTSGRQRAQLDSIASFRLASPVGENIWGIFAQMIVPIFESIKENSEASISLAELRDTLLPKLVSGELRIKSARKALSETISC